MNQSVLSMLLLNAAVCLLLVCSVVQGGYVYRTETIGGGFANGYVGDNVNASTSGIYAGGGIAFDSKNRYFYYYDQDRIRKIDLNTNMVTTVVGNGERGQSQTTTQPSATSTVYYGLGMAMWKGKLLFSDSESYIRMYDPALQLVTHFAGTSTKGFLDNVNPKQAQFTSILCLFVSPSDDIYVCDQSVVRKINGTSLAVTTIVGTANYGSAPASEPEEVTPTLSIGQTVSIAMDSNGTLLIAMGYNQYRVRKYYLDPQNGKYYLKTILGGGPSGTSNVLGTNFNMATFFVNAISVYNDEMFTSASGGNAIRKLRFSDGMYVDVLGTGTSESSPDGPVSASSDIFYPSIHTIDNTTGAIYFIEVYYSRLRKLEGGQLTTIADSQVFNEERDAKNVWYAGFSGAAMTPEGDFYFTENESNCVKFFNMTSRKVSRKFGRCFFTCARTVGIANPEGYGGQAVNARFWSLGSGIAVANNGDVYVGDSGDYQIRLITKATGIISRFGGGSGGTCANGMDPKTCMLGVPRHISIMQNDDVYVGGTSGIFKISHTDGLAYVVYSTGSCNGMYLRSDGVLFFIDSSGTDVFYIATNGTVLPYTVLPVYSSYNFYVSLTGEVYFTQSSDMVKKFNPTSNQLTTFAGSYSGNYNDGELSTNSKFNSVYMLMWHSQSNSFLAFEHQRTRKIYPVCADGYTGANCSIPICFSINGTDPSVCSGHGTCNAPDSCSCKTGYLNSDCSDWTCFGYSSSVSLGCSGKGQCVDYETCTCNPHYYGNRCNIKECFGMLSNSSSVCNEMGTCQDYNTCVCYSGWSGSICSIPSCNGVPANNTQVCSVGHGTCIGLNNCSCLAEYEGTWCEYKKCNGLSRNNALVCNQRGTCGSDGSCSCQTGWGGSNCEIPSCNGILANDSSVCSNGHGFCVGLNNCSCQIGYSGSNCEILSCNGVFSNNPSICNSHGTCIGLNNCSCLADYEGTWCENKKCNGISRNNALVCNQKGTCGSDGSCSCQNGWTGSNCEKMICFGIEESNVTVCNGFGSCILPDHCNCTKGYIGPQCETHTCNGLSLNSSQVCSGHGQCIQLDTCQCTSGYSGVDCSVYTKEIITENPTTKPKDGDSNLLLLLLLLLLIVVVVVVVVVGIAICYCCCKKKAPSSVPGKQNVELKV